MTTADYDVAIAGGGPAGTALACRLAAAGRSVAVFEGSRYESPRIGESLAPAVQPLLTELGVWDAFAALGPLPSWGTRSRWGTDEVESHSHLHTACQQGWHVDRRAVDEMLARAASERGAQVRRGSRVARVTFRGDGWQLERDGHSSIGAHVLVDATGRRSLLARQLGARRLAFDHLVAVGATWEDAVSGQHHVLVEATPEGWWYSAPLPSGSLITLLMTDADLCRDQRLTAPPVWLSALHGASETAARVTGARLDDKHLLVHPATSMRSVRRTDHRPWLAVGDAGLAVDPVTGSGVARALRSAASATHTVGSLLDGDPSTHAAEMALYERARDAEFSAFLQTRRGYYAAVDSLGGPFWSRRRAVNAGPLVT